MTALPDLADFLPMIAAIVAGGLVGLERETRGRSAGFRTHILVCLASALLMQASLRQGDWPIELIAGQRIVADPARLAHGVLTGIGFLCAGVIFRSGFSIHGLTTAAALWITAAIGILLGAELYWLALAGTAVTVVTLMILRVVSMRLPEQVIVDAEATWPRGAGGVEARVEAILEARCLAVRQGRFELDDGGQIVLRRWRLRLDNKQNLKALAEELRAVRELTRYRLDPRDD